MVLTVSGHFFLLIFLLIWSNSCGRITPIGPCILIADEPCSNDYVQFYLYTRTNKNEPKLVTFQNGINVSGFNFSKPVSNKFIVHGYNSNMNESVLQDIKSEYLLKEDTNIWMVDWSKLVKGPCYITAIYNIKHTGKCLAEMVKKVVSKNKYSDIHMIGFSLGAHVPAAAATYLLPYKMPRITGLDPAFPLMSFQSSANKLNPSHAEFVDVIHTNALVQGQLEPAGHADFYMNNAITQPGCSSAQSTVLDNFNCDHHRSAVYFAESINSLKGFWGWRCNRYTSILLGECNQPKGDPVLMGASVETLTRGVFKVKTSNASPFALGKWNLSTCL